MASSFLLPRKPDITLFADDNMVSLNFTKSKVYVLVLCLFRQTVNFQSDIIVAIQFYSILSVYQKREKRKIHLPAATTITHAIKNKRIFYFDRSMTRLSRNKTKMVSFGQSAL